MEAVIIILSIVNGSVALGFHIIIIDVILTAGLIISVFLLVYFLLCWMISIIYNHKINSPFSKPVIDSAVL